jgi:acetylglutamate kinase
VLKEVDNPDSLIEQINKKDFQQLKSDKIIADGMLPKMDNCFYALEKGVKKVIIGGAQVVGNQSSQHTEISLK